jgi:hypothetical protein
MFVLFTVYYLSNGILSELPIVTLNIFIFARFCVRALVSLMTMLSLSAEPYSQCRLLCILLYLNRSVKESGKIEYSYQLGGKEATYTQERGDQTTPAINVLNAKRCSAREECMEATFLAFPGHILQLLLDVGGDINYSTIVLPYHIIFKSHADIYSNAKGIASCVDLCCWKPGPRTQAQKHLNFVQG